MLDKDNFFLLRIFLKEKIQTRSKHSAWHIIHTQVTNGLKFSAHKYLDGA